MRAQWPYRGPWPGRVAARASRVAATVPLTPAHSPPAARACRAPFARLRSSAPRAPAHTRSSARACAQRPYASACSPSTLARSAYRAPSAVLWPPSRPYNRAQRPVAARPWPYRGRGRALGLRPACPGPQYNIFVLPYDFEPTAPKKKNFHYS